MATVLFFHAHPDDEAIATGGTMAKLTDEGHRVICVHATRGEMGEVDEGFLDEGEELASRRTTELESAWKILGVARGEFLGYRDSDMMGRAANDDPRCFWRADVEEAAARLAAIAQEEGVDVLVAYDDHGNYGHPDHIQVHRVGVRAAEMAGIDRVYESTVDRDLFRKLFEQAAAAAAAEGDGGTGADDGSEMPQLPDTEGVDDTMGSPAWMITTRVDVTDHLDVKRAAMAAHASQIGESSFFLSMPPRMFADVWGSETYIRRGAPEGTVETSLVEGL